MEKSNMSRWLKAALAAVLVLPVVSWYADLFVDPLEAARDGSGNYTVPNTFSPGDTITASDFNQNFSDVGTEITNSLPRDGQAGMTGQFKASNGSAAVPGISFSSDVDTGFYRAAANQIGIAVAGSQVGTISSTGLSMEGTAFTSAVTCGFRANEPTGWVYASGLTIGNAASGGTARANADTETLFTVLWNDSTNTELPIQDSAGSASTRGASAAADFAANKRMPVPDLQGRVVAGKDDMSGTSANRLTGTDTDAVGVDGDTLGGTGGEELTTDVAAHLHGDGSYAFSDSFTTSSDTHNHDPDDPSRNFITTGVLDSVQNGGGADTWISQEVRTDDDTHSHTGSVSGSVTGNSGTTGDASVTNVQPTLILNCFIKL